MTFAFCCDTALLFVQHAVILSSVVQIIKDLGGHALDSATWDSRCSHLIAGSANRSEKYLAACASGAWVLRPSFIEASQQAGAFFLSLPPQTSGGLGDTGFEVCLYSESDLSYNVFLACFGRANLESAGVDVFIKTYVPTGHFVDEGGHEYGCDERPDTADKLVMVSMYFCVRSSLQCLSVCVCLLAWPRTLFMVGTGWQMYRF